MKYEICSCRTAWNTHECYQVQSGKVLLSTLVSKSIFLLLSLRMLQFLQWLDATESSHCTAAKSPLSARHTARFARYWGMSVLVQSMLWLARWPAGSTKWNQIKIKSRAMTNDTSPTIHPASDYFQLSRLSSVLLCHQALPERMRDKRVPGPADRGTAQGWPLSRSTVCGCQQTEWGSESSGLAMIRYQVSAAGGNKDSELATG